MQQSFKRTTNGNQTTILNKEYNIYISDDMNNRNTIISNQSNRKKTCQERYFSEMKEGSMRAAQLNLIASMIGVGYLTLPSIGVYSGYLGIFYFISI